MDPELKRLLDENLMFAKDNNRILHAMRRDQWIALAGRIVIWIIILVLPFYLYQHYLQPLVAKFSVTTGIKMSGPFGLPTSAEMQKLIDSIKAGH